MDDDSSPDAAAFDIDPARHAEVQYAVSRVLSDAVSVDSAAVALLPALGEALQWQYAGSWIVRRESTEIECTHAWSIAEPRVTEFAGISHGLRFKPGDGLPGRCWQDGSALWLSRVQRETRMPRIDSVRKAGLHGAVAFPVVNREGVVGVVECFTWRTESVTPQFLRLTEAIGRQIGQFIQRRALEEQLEENEARYAAIINGSLDAIIAMDEQGLVREFNIAAQRLFGYARDEAVGHELAALIVPPHLRDAHRAGLRRHQASGQSQLLERRVELTTCRRDGSDFPVELTITRMRVRGAWTFIGFVRDITERQQHERERESLIERDRAARDDAETANALKDEFLAALSHELRTPLNAVLGWSDMLAKGAVDEARLPRIAGTIRRNALAQKRLVDDMLDLSAFVAGRVRLTTESLPIGTSVQAACEVVEPAAKARRIRIDIDVPSLRVCADRLRLQQVFWNLLNNAIKFTPPGGSIRVSGARIDDDAVVTVTDTGRGIDPAFLPHVFERFRQGRDAREHGGLGLGLAIVKQIVEAHGGTVAAESGGPGAGATVIVRLPIDPAAG